MFSPLILPPRSFPDSPTPFYLFQLCPGAPISLHKPLVSLFLNPPSLPTRGIYLCSDHITALFSVLQWLPNSYRAELSFLTQALRCLHHLVATSLSVCLPGPAFLFLPFLYQAARECTIVGTPNALWTSLCLELS